MHEILKLDIVSFGYRLRDRTFLVIRSSLWKSLQQACLSLLLASLLDAQSVNFFRVPFSDVLARSICDREIFTRVCRGFKTFCTQRTNLHIFFFIHSNAVTKSFFEVKFSWSAGDAGRRWKFALLEVFIYWSVYSFKVFYQITGKRTFHREYLFICSEDMLISTCTFSKKLSWAMFISWYNYLVTLVAASFLRKFIEEDWLKFRNLRLFSRCFWWL